MDDQRLEAGSDWRTDIGSGILAGRIIGKYLLKLQYVLMMYVFYSILGESYFHCE